MNEVNITYKETIMEASKVTVTPETMVRNTLTPKRKKELRQRLIMDYIRKRPAGAMIHMDKLIYAGGWTTKQYGSGWAFIQRMARDGIITIEGYPKTTNKSFTIPGDSNIIQPATPTADQVADAVVGAIEADVADEDKPKQPSFSLKTDSLDDFSKMAAGWAVQRAKSFAWAKNSDSLREFVEHLEIVA